jgi:hypothetical protein
VLVFVLHRAVNRPAMFVKKLVDKASKKVRLLSLTDTSVLSQFPFLPSPFFGLGSWLKIRTIE